MGGDVLKVMPKAKAVAAIKKVVNKVVEEAVKNASGIPAHWGETEIRWYITDAVRDKGMFKVKDLKQRREYLSDCKEFGL